MRSKVETEELLATVMETCPKPNMAVVVKVYQDAFRKSQALGDVVVQERILDALVQGLNNAGRVKEARKLLPQLRTLHARCGCACCPRGSASPLTTVRVHAQHR